MDTPSNFNYVTRVASITHFEPSVSDVLGRSGYLSLLTRGVGNDIFAVGETSLLDQSQSRTTPWTLGSNDIPGGTVRRTDLFIEVASTSGVEHATGENIGQAYLQELTANPLAEVDFTGLLAMTREGVIAGTAAYAGATPWTSPELGRACDRSRSLIAIHESSAASIPREIHHTIKLPTYGSRCI